MSAEDEIRDASKAFYEALGRMANGDADGFAAIWSHDESATAMHPIGGRTVGWGEVQTSFAQVAGMASGGQVELHDQVIQVVGDAAYELGIERGRMTLAGREIAFDHRVTNIYRREAGAWKMVHHHTDTSAAMIDLLKSLQS